MKAVPAAVLTLWMPALFLVGLCLFLNGLPWQYWAICIPIMPLLAYMNTLAEIHNSDGQIRIRRWWGSIYVARSEILDISPSMLEGIGRLRLRRFIPPWGIIYFVADWSSVEVPQSSAEIQRASRPANPRVPDLVASVLLGTSGFVLGRALNGDFHKLSIGSRVGSILALTASVGLGALFMLVRKRFPTLANILLFAAALVAALVRI